ncbi:hypothetical protein LBMAG18_06550 [Alphaproteobacteria bacterium]|nr:hypothetical protein LBMAG18_06550 [Alphaproteobacteria bacterium]
MEAVSNNINTLSEPRVRTAKITMFLVAISLAFMVAGIILLYLLWGVNKAKGQTLNATTFCAITESWCYKDIQLGKFGVPVVLIL